MFRLQLVVIFIALIFCIITPRSVLFFTSICISKPANLLSIVLVFTEPMLIPDLAKTDPKSDKTPTLSSVLTAILALYK